MPEYIMKDKENPAFESLDEFTQGYIEALFFTEEERLAEENESLESRSVMLRKTANGIESEFIGGNIGFDLLAPEALAKIISDCARFQVRAFAPLASSCRINGYDSTLAGHDFWFTRNGHGVGFWDRGLGSLGEALTKISKKYGESDLYLGDDGKIYVS